MNRYNQSGEQVKKISKEKSLSISKRLEKIRQEKLKEMSQRKIVTVSPEEELPIFIKEGVLEDMFENEDGSMGIEIESEKFEISPLHFQKVIRYMASEAEIRLEVDLEARKSISIEAKDPSVRVSKLQESLFLKELANVEPTSEALMHCFNRAEYLYSELVKGKASDVGLERMAG